MGDDKGDRKAAEEIETGVEGALGHATVDEQTHSDNDRTTGPPAPPEQRDDNAPTD